jgi:uncharacterized protein (TIGR02453 family)
VKKKTEERGGSFTGFRPAAFTFLRGLRRNNRKEWFEAHRASYASDVRAPMLALVDELDAVLGAVAPEFRGDPKKSVFRIYRDVRFSADKSPYKTHIACWLFHEDAGSGVGQEAHGGGGFYVHIEPGACMVGGGMWMPPKPALDRIRDALVADLKGFEKLMADRAFRRRFPARGSSALSEEEMLMRVPRGYEPEHPAARWLRYKSFTVGRKLRDTDVGSAKLVATMRSDISSMLPFVRWLNSAMGLQPRKSR